MSHKLLYTLHKKITFSIRDFFSKCDQIRLNWPKFSFYGNKVTVGKFNLRWYRKLADVSKGALVSGTDPVKHN